LRKEWANASSRAGVKHLPFYVATKHSLLTHIRSQGCSMDDVREFAGLTDVRTAERYAVPDSIKLSRDIQDIVR